MGFIWFYNESLIHFYTYRIYKLQLDVNGHKLLGNALANRKPLTVLN